MAKACNKCDQEKPEGEFFVRPRNKGGLSHQCKGCEIGKTNEWRSANRDRVNQAARTRKRVVTRAQRMAWTYGITVEQYDALLESQGGRCAICKTSEPGGRGEWHIDHDHACCSGMRKACGKCVRGLLCARCNPMIGMARDDMEVLMAAIEYLKFGALMGALGVSEHG